MSVKKKLFHKIQGYVQNPKKHPETIGDFFLKFRNLLQNPRGKIAKFDGKSVRAHMVSWEINEAKESLARI